MKDYIDNDAFKRMSDDFKTTGRKLFRPSMLVGEPGRTSGAHRLCDPVPDEVQALVGGGWLREDVTVWDLRSEECVFAGSRLDALTRYPANGPWFDEYGEEVARDDIAMWLNLVLTDAAEQAFQQQMAASTERALADAFEALSDAMDSDRPVSAVGRVLQALGAALGEEAA